MAQLPQDFGQRFLVTVDTEEEFDWTRPFARAGHTTHAVPWIARFQQFCESHGVVPTYLVDHPVAVDPEAARILSPAVEAGRADIGLQLHPWVNPPFDEEINIPNSFPGNLSVELECAKLLALKSEIEARFGVTPLTYRAGRYGVGPNTAALLIEAGIRIDTSVRARFDYRDMGGPDFRACPSHPWWVDDNRRLLELPLTTAFTGHLRRHGAALYPRLAFSRRLRGALAMTNLIERIPLSPEGVTVEEGLRAMDTAVVDGVPVLVFSFHSPSLAPGHTPYVRSEADLDALYAWWRVVFAHAAARGLHPTTPREILGALDTRDRDLASARARG